MKLILQKIPTGKPLLYCGERNEELRYTMTCSGMRIAEPPPNWTRCIYLHCTSPCAEIQQAGPLRVPFCKVTLLSRSLSPFLSSFFCILGTVCVVEKFHVAKMAWSLLSSLCLLLTAAAGTRAAKESTDASDYKTINVSVDTVILSYRDYTDRCDHYSCEHTV